MKKTLKRLFNLGLVLALLLTSVPVMAKGSYYKDVPKKSPYHKDIEYCRKNDLLPWKGKKFHPKKKVTSIELANIFYNIYGEVLPMPEEIYVRGKIIDLPEDDPNMEVILWAIHYDVIGAEYDDGALSHIGGSFKKGFKCYPNGVYWYGQYWLYVYMLATEHLGIKFPNAKNIVVDKRPKEDYDIHIYAVEEFVRAGLFKSYKEAMKLFEEDLTREKLARLLHWFSELPSHKKRMKELKAKYGIE